MGERTGDGHTVISRGSERELVVTRIFDAPVRLVYDAWTKAELFQLWWAPKSIGVPMLACEMDVRTDGGYRITFGRDEANSRSFFGKYLEVTPNARIVWTNDEGDEDGAVTTVTFEEQDGGKTLLVMRELYPSKEALDRSAGAMDAALEQFGQLDELLATFRAGA
jgi:uncharacterized protein YndB with AHSA1/START domain